MWITRLLSLTNVKVMINNDLVIHYESFIMWSYYKVPPRNLPTGISGKPDKFREETYTHKRRGWRTGPATVQCLDQGKNDTIFTLPTRFSLQSDSRFVKRTLQPVTVWPTSPSSDLTWMWRSRSRVSPGRPIPPQGCTWLRHSRRWWWQTAPGSTWRGRPTASTPGTNTPRSHGGYPAGGGRSSECAVPSRPSWPQPGGW